ncbi:hypothetical protein BJ912DRAFT_926758 [Pholiota molesta]|nr:hypothetical protein BJ912DRAFT_926758 [Pholiota molesta]
MSTTPMVIAPSSRGSMSMPIPSASGSSLAIALAFSSAETIFAHLCCSLCLSAARLRSCYLCKTLPAHGDCMPTPKHAATRRSRETAPPILRSLEMQRLQIQGQGWPRPPAAGTPSEPTKALLDDKWSHRVCVRGPQFGVGVETKRRRRWWRRLVGVWLTRNQRRRLRAALEQRMSCPAPTSGYTLEDLVLALALSAETFEHRRNPWGRHLCGRRSKEAGHAALRADGSSSPRAQLLATRGARTEPFGDPAGSARQSLRCPET